MLLAALLDLGDARQMSQALLRALRLPPRTLRLRRVAVRSLAGLQCRVTTRGPRAHSLLPWIACVTRSRLPARAKRRARAILRRLAAAEHRVHHGTAHAHRVHELGRVDTLIAVAGCAFALEQLRLRRVFVGPIPLGHGTIRAEEGWLPNPGPAVLELLRGWPVVMTRRPDELVTPTAAAILTTLAQPLPTTRRLVVTRIGCGVGTKRIPGVPGVLRACLSGGGARRGKA